MGIWGKWPPGKMSTRANGHWTIWGQMSKMPISPICLFVPVLTCFQCHLFQTGLPFDANIHLPKVLICPNCPAMPICFGAHFSWCPFPPMSIRPNVHRSQMPICLKCRFALVLIFPSAHFSPMPICPNAQRSQSAHLVQKCSFAANSLLVCPGTNFSWCSFSPSVHIFPQCPLDPMLIGPKVPIFPNAHLFQSPHAH